MAKEQDSLDAGALLEALPKAIAQATVELQSRERPLELNRFDRKTAFNPTGGKRPKLTRKTYFCGHEEEEGSLTNEEIELYNKVQPGDYQNGTWKVRERRGNATTPAEIFISLPVADSDMRAALPNKLTTLLREIIAEAESRSPVAAR